MNEFYPFPKIGQFRNTIRAVSMRSAYVGKEDDGSPIYDESRPRPVLPFVGTVKLHGTNAAIVFHPDGEITCQSRSQIITPDADNAGFAAWVEEHKTILFDRFMPLVGEEPLIIFGEWCGKGINKGAAVCQLPKMFVVFNAKFGTGENAVWFSPASVANLPRHPVINLRNIYEFQHYMITIDFEKPAVRQSDLVVLTAAVEAQCPVAKAHGLDGIGEGIVWRCVYPDYWQSDFWFKVKGEKHSATKVKTLAPVDAEQAEKVSAFVDAVATESRLEQGIEWLREQGKEVSRASTGDYLRWVFNDVLDEESDTMGEHGITEKDIGSPLSRAARIWFFARLDSAWG